MVRESILDLLSLQLLDLVQGFLKGLVHLWLLPQPAPLLLNPAASGRLRSGRLEMRSTAGVAKSVLQVTIGHTSIRSVSSQNFDLVQVAHSVCPGRDFLNLRPQKHLPPMNAIYSLLLCMSPNGRMLIPSNSHLTR